MKVGHGGGGGLQVCRSPLQPLPLSRAEQGKDLEGAGLLGGDPVSVTLKG